MFFLNNVYTLSNIKSYLFLTLKIRIYTYKWRKTHSMFYMRWLFSQTQLFNELTDKLLTIPAIKKNILNSQ